MWRPRTVFAAKVSSSEKTDDHLDDIIAPVQHKQNNWNGTFSANHKELNSGHTKLMLMQMQNVKFQGSGGI